MWWIDLMRDMHFTRLGGAVDAFDLVATLTLIMTLLIFLATVNRTDNRQLLLCCLLLILAFRLLILLGNMNFWRALL